MGIEQRARRVADLAAAGDLAEACFELAGFEYPDLDASRYRVRLDELGALVDGSDYSALRRVIAIQEGYGGTLENYHDPANSYLHEVLDRRTGLPITLATIWIEVGQRAALDVQGVGLPGHFLIYAQGQLIDPFHGGEPIGSDEAAALVAEALGGPRRLNPDWLEPVTEAEIVERMLRNLHQAYSLAEDEPPRPWIDACFEALGVGSGV
ncbi:MAG: transglutaminase family protein [Acidimicrobiia bacterium]